MRHLIERSIKMENYKLGGVTEEGSRSLPFRNLPENITHVKVKGGSHINHLIGFALDKFQVDHVQSIVFSGSGNGVTKAISCVEIMKRKIKELHQVSQIRYEKISETWEPLLPELDSLKVLREIPAIYMLLSKDAMFASEPGYQAPSSHGTFCCESMATKSSSWKPHNTKRQRQAASRHAPSGNRKRGMSSSRGQQIAETK